MGCPARRRRARTHYSGMQRIWAATLRIHFALEPGSRLCYARCAFREGLQASSQRLPRETEAEATPGDLGFVAGIKLEGIGSGACGFSLGDDRVDLSARMAFWDFVSLCKSNSNARSRISWDRRASAVALLGSDSAQSDSGVASGQRLWGIGSAR
jgi:hypothetical protein